MKVKVKSDTLFKLQPKLSRELADSEKVFVKNKTEYEIEFYTEVGNNHVRLELANVALGDQKTFTWYAYKPDIEIVGSSITAKVVSDTLFKAAPVLSTELSDRDKVFVKNGTEFELQSYAPAAANHTRIAIANAFLGPDNRNTWYAYNPDLKIEGQKINLRVISDTLFKAKPVMSSQLPASDKVFVPNGTTFDLHSYADAEASHIKVALSGAFLGPQNRTTWYAFAPDIEIEGNDPRNRPNDSNPAALNPPPPNDRGQPLRFPGFRGVYYTNDPILSGGNFTWAEATHGGTRIPVSADVVYGMIRIAEVLEDIRSMFGNRPIQINSWYRDPATNLAVGGASMSQHLTGSAVDFVVPGYHPYDVFAILDPWWGSRGGLASSTVFTHIDARGYRARWDYGY
ncbi:MAG: D-Ala-D-Ala carboxypeptidase family metallohydrolase [Cyanobacteria bacterium P01_H01_bin.58]